MSLLFLHNNLLNSTLRNEMRLPLHFVSFATVEGKMFWSYGKRDTFIVQEKDRAWGNPLIMGAIFHLSDFDYYIRIMDSYHACSLSAIRRNHRNDLHHRQRVLCTPISFASLSDLGRMIYTEKEEQGVSCYFGNPNHPKISVRLRNKKLSYRITEGVDKISFASLYREVSNDRGLSKGLQ